MPGRSMEISVTRSPGGDGITAGTLSGLVLAGDGCRL